MLTLDKVPLFEEGDIIESLQDGIIMMEALSAMEPSAFKSHEIVYDDDDTYQAYKNYAITLSSLKAFYEQMHGLDDPNLSSKGRDAVLKSTKVFSSLVSLDNKLNTMKADIEQTSIRSINQAAFVNIESLMVIMELSLGVAVNCENTQAIIGNFTENLPQDVLEDLMLITQDVIDKYGKLEPDEDEENQLDEGTIVMGAG